MRSIAILFLFGCCLYNPVKCQTTDLVRLEYSYVPQSGSENSVNRFRTFINYPIKLDDDGTYLVPGFEYRYVRMDIDDPVPFDPSRVKDLQTFQLGLGATFKLSDKWRIGAKAGMELASNFEQDKIRSADIFFTGAGYLIRDRSGEGIEKPDRLIIGLHYATSAGRPFPLPIISYFRKFHSNWSYSLGSPKTNLKYTFASKNSIQGFVTFDGFYANLQNNIQLEQPGENMTSADNISMTLVLTGLGYEYSFTKNVFFYAYGGHTLFNEIRLRDSKRNKLFTINEKNTFYLRGGFKLKI